MDEILQATSNVIELKPGHSYLFVLKGKHIDSEALNDFQDRLAAMGMNSLSIVLSNDQDMHIIEQQK